MSFRYRNRKTGSVSTYATVMPTLERSDRWERLTEEDSGPQRPAASANKDEWVAYVEARGGDTGDKTVDELKAAADELEQA